MIGCWCEGCVVDMAGGAFTVLWVSLRRALCLFLSRRDFNFFFFFFLASLARMLTGGPSDSELSLPVVYT